MRLETPHDVGVVFRRPHGRIDIDTVRLVQGRVVVTLDAADEVGREERDNPAFLRVDHVLAERGQRHARRAALVEERGDSGMHSDQVGVQPEAAGDVLEDMAVRVDQAGQHELAGNVRHLPGRRGNDVRSDGGNFSVFDGDVEGAVDALRRIDHAPAAQQKVVLHGFLHRKSPPGLYPIREEGCEARPDP